MGLGPGTIHIQFLEFSIQLNPLPVARMRDTPVDVKKTGVLHFQSGSDSVCAGGKNG